MDAAIEVMTRRDYLEVSVADVLAEAGVSTRAFYRHFESKDALLVALMRRDAESVGRLLQRAVDRAADPAEAVAAWLDAYLAVFYEPKRARRTLLYASPGVRASSAVAVEHAELRQILARPLVETLRAGHGASVLHSPDPDGDAMSILALVGAAAANPGAMRSRKAARDLVMRFAWPALGLPLR
jgi:AcrR family transcriptional regulator